jgi:hypothetical protein
VTPFRAGIGCLKRREFITLVAAARYLASFASGPLLQGRLAGDVAVVEKIDA